MYVCVCVYIYIYVYVSHNKIKHQILYSKLVTILEVFLNCNRCATLLYIQSPVPGSISISPGDPIPDCEALTWWHAVHSTHKLKISHTVYTQLSFPFSSTNISGIKTRLILNLSQAFRRMQGTTAGLLRDMLNWTVSATVEVILMFTGPCIIVIAEG